MKKLFALVMASALSLSLLAGCGGGEEPAPAPAPAPDGGDEAATGAVYYLNFKPEQDEAWQNLAAAYTEETGVPVTVVTAASGTYETQLMSEIAKSNPPTLFQVNGPNGLVNWGDYCLDLTDSAVVAELTNDSFVLKDGDAVKAVAYVIESYGLITNTKLLAEAGYSVDDIKSFEDLKKVAEDITARKDELGFAAFCSAGMDPSSDWRFKTHLANLPIYFEYQADGIDSTTELKGTYLDNYKAIWDLYINNATCAPADLAAKTGDDAVAEFVGEQAVFYQNGSWAYGDVKGLGDENLAMIPIYVGAGDEANQGLCTGSENYWCVNSDAAPENIQATLDFMEWVVTSDKGTTALASDMGFVVPFKNAKEAENLFVKQDVAYTAEGKLPVSWNFTTMPSENWKNDVGSALTAYAAGTGDWSAVVTAFVDGWATEYAALQG